MKRTISTLIILFLACLVAKADFVTEQKAREIAEDWFREGEISLSLNSQRSIWYINNSLGGWLLLSAEDCTSPVLGYSDEGSIGAERLNPQLAALLKDCGNGILQARAEGIKASSEIQRQWAMAGQRTKAAKGKLLKTANWGQESPYNNLCPTVTEKGVSRKAVTGCVATAMSIICRYHQWPEKGSGTVGGYSYTGSFNNKESIPSVDISSHRYDYSLMPLEYSASASSDECQAVAQLMVDMGYAATLYYGYTYGTGGITTTAVMAMYKHFGYRGDANYVARSSYDDGRWITMLCEEIDKGNPILYGASDSTGDGGHQFICDGYDSRRFIHINWGWDGNDNGYFNLSLNIPGSYTYSLDQDAVLGLEPDKDANSSVSVGELQYYYSDSSNYNDITPSSGDLRSGWKCNTYIMNLMSDYNYNGKVRAALLDWKGNLKEVLSSEVNCSISSYRTNIVSISAKAASSLAAGDRAVLQYLYGDEWRTVMPYNKNEQRWCLSAVDMPLILCEDNYNSGDEFILEVLPGNKAIKSYVWYLDNTKQSYQVLKSLSKGQHNIKVVITLSGGGSVTLQKTINVN